MFKLSCFHYHPHAHKPKAQEYNLRSTINPSLMEAVEKVKISCQTKIVKSSSLIERDRSSDEMQANRTLVNEMKSHQTGLKKSKSLGCVLLEESCASGSNNETETERTHDSNGLTGRDDKKDEVASFSNMYPDLLPDSVQVGSNRANDESIFSVGGSELLEKDVHASSVALLSDECAKEDSSDHTPRAMPVIVKSRSSPSIACHSPPRKPARSRSSQDLHVLDMRRKENSYHEVAVEHLSQDENRDDGMGKNEADIYNTTAEDGYDSYNYVAAKDWIIPVVDEAEMDKNALAESSRPWEEAPHKDFKTKRIEDWVMDLQHCAPLEEEDPVPSSNEPVKRVTNATEGLTAVKMDPKVTPGMEAAKKYISALSPASTAAHLENHGLVVIPFLSAFVGLKVLNLSGNAIVRITAGALPRGLHVLNLSKNHITTIEGLRELTRLRVLDLSYNRIFRIGHGLASCSSLKELYLAGNKISEVEGLHRLLKLNVLDLRFNKLSTTKCLGQLAANYNSLQAISLEGNPAQKNVGDDQLKKYLQGLLPHLAYYNRQPIKSSSLKDAADRSLRLGISDRSLRTDPKLGRKTAAHKTVASSSHGRKTQAVVSPKVSRGRHGGLPPPSGTKAVTSQKPSYFEFTNKLLSLRSDLAMRRSRSEGTLGAL
uniref:Uncharacterized protein n=1 Tax=Kalanchoe fedtschenkoi TaxID=63787 RepID=A0A7N0TKG2_KALFE